MKTLSTQVADALAAGTLVPRDFLWITARDRATGAPVSHGMWSDRGTVSAPVIEPVSGVTVTRSWEGAGGLIEVRNVTLSLSLTVNTVEIVLSQIDAQAEQIVRGLDPRRAPVELYRGFLDPLTQQLVAPAVARFRGFVDGAPITTPAEGGEGSITLTCAAYTQELTRASASKRSDADQRRRDASDAFFKDVTTVGDWEIFWGIPEPAPEAGSG